MAVATLIISVGLLLRVRALVQNRSLNIDEASIALHLRWRSWPELFEPMWLGQAVPPGMLAALKGLVALFGEAEWTLRLLPFAAGCLALFLFKRLAERELPVRAALLALAIFAVSPMLVAWSAIAKPYMLDVVATVALLGYVRGVHGVRDGISAGLAGGVALWFSHGVVFPLSTIAAVLGIQYVRDKESRGAIRWAAALWIALGLPGLLLSLHLRSPDTAAYMQVFWADGFFAFPPGAADIVSLATRPLLVMTHVLGAANVLYAASLLVFASVGLIVLYREVRPELLVWLAIPLTMAVAAFLHGYPLGGTTPTGGRVLLLILPVVILVLARGLTVVSGPRMLRSIEVLAIAPLLFLTLIDPVGYPDTRSVLQYAVDRRAVADVIYVNYVAAPAALYYAPRTAMVLGECHRHRPAGYLEELARLNEKRVWVVASHDLVIERPLLAEYLALNGKLLDAATALGADAWLYHLGPLPHRRPAAVPDGPWPFASRVPCAGPFDLNGLPGSGVAAIQSRLTPAE